MHVDGVCCSVVIGSNSWMLLFTTMLTPDIRLSCRIYMDVDVECVTPFDSLIDPLPPGAAWVGDNPEVGGDMCMVRERWTGRK